MDVSNQFLFASLNAQVLFLSHLKILAKAIGITFVN